MNKNELKNVSLGDDRSVEAIVVHVFSALAMLPIHQLFCVVFCIIKTHIREIVNGGREPKNFYDLNCVCGVLLGACAEKLRILGRINIISWGD